MRTLIERVGAGEPEARATADSISGIIELMKGYRPMTQPQITKAQWNLARQFVAQFDPENLSAEMLGALSALIALGENVASGEYVVVPREPTDAMKLAGAEILVRQISPPPHLVYEAMIAAEGK